MIRVEQSTRLAAPARTVWERAVTPAGINDELRPLVRMTVPRRLRGATIEDAPLGEAAGRSWILLLGVVPVEFDDLRLVELEPGRRFLERSRMATLDPWQHERVIDPDGERACRVTDRLAFAPRGALGRVPGSGALARATVKALFRHRHRRLLRRYGV